MKQKFICLILSICILTCSFGQDLLSKNISLNINRQRIDHVLEIISNQGNFYFSYNSNIIKKDSLVSFSVSNRSVKEVLGMIFNNTYEFRESGSYIIIRKAPIHLVMVTKKAASEDKIYSVSGFVYDEESGAAINEASIYEKKLLASALTNNDGFFKLRLKSGKASVAELTVSKEFYEDTTVVIAPRHNQELTITMMPMERESETITIRPQDLLLPDSLKPKVVGARPNVTISDTIKVEKSSVGKFLVSAKQKVQSLNLNKFFTTRPFQASILPGIGSHGKLSGQVVNNFSLNMFGGYTAGTNGVEIGGLFNIDKKGVKYFQAAGLFNAVGGPVEGVQTAGINNTVLDSVKAFQTAGISNFVKGKFAGFQTAGIYNHVGDSLKGVQVAGVANFVRKKVTGVQVAGVINFSNKETSGAQIAGVINYSKKLRGLQIGLINISDTSEGFSIGLINIVVKGYHKLSFSTNEVMDVTGAFKTGNSKLYSILLAGVKTRSNNRILSFGYGLGSEFVLNKQKSLSINPELTAEYLYLGSWDYVNILSKLHLNLNFRVNKYISIFGGPSYGVYASDQDIGVAGYKFPILPTGYKTHGYSDKVSGWLGWNAGISFF
jgi:hypothetical protein